MADRVTISDGEMHSESLAGFNTQSSNNYEDTGVKAKTSLGFSRTVQNPDQLNDNDLVEVDNMQITAKMAREMGLLGNVFDAELSMSAAQEHQTKADQTEEKSNTGNEAYDSAIDSLNDHLEDGSMTYEEAAQYEDALGEVALGGISIDHLVETIDGLADGTVAVNAVPADIKHIAEGVESKVTEAATSTAVNELGQDAFDDLSNMASLHPDVNNVIRKYAIDRAQGKHGGVTWAELHQDLREQLNIA